MDIKDNIIQSSERMFLQYGIRSISMDDIARELSISKKTIYQYFKDKEELVYEVSLFHIDRQTREILEVAEKASNSIEYLILMSQCLRNSVETMHPSLLFDLEKFYPRAWQEYQSFKKEFLKKSLIDSINQGKEEGYFREELSAEVLAVLRMEEIQMCFNNLIFPRLEFDFKQVQRCMFDHFVYGIINEEGKKLYEQYLN